MDIGFLGDWGLVDRIADQEGYSESTPKVKKNYSLQNFYVNTKSRLYNLVRPSKYLAYKRQKPQVVSIILLEVSNSLPDFTESPLVLLGRVYIYDKDSCEVRPQDGILSTPTPPPNGKIWGVPVGYLKLRTSTAQPEKPIYSHVTDFLKDLSSKIWLTYRSQFPPIEPTNYTTDMGWGCMLRTGQMLLAQAFVFHYLGRDWRLSSNEHMLLYYQILRWFADEPHAPYSIHMIAQMANARFGKRVGEWFEPTTICYTLSELVSTHHPDGLRMYVAKDGMISRNDIEDMCIYTRPVSSCPTPAVTMPAQLPQPQSRRLSLSLSFDLILPPESVSLGEQQGQQDPSAIPHQYSTSPSPSCSSPRKTATSPNSSDSDVAPLPSPLLSVPNPLHRSDESPVSSPSTSPLLPMRSDIPPLMTSPTEVKKHPLLSSSSLSSSRSSMSMSASLDLDEPQEKEKEKEKDKDDSCVAAEVEEEVEEEEMVELWCPVVILIPARLGVDSLNPVYAHALREFLSFPQALGIVGGKPQSSFYFIGYQDDTLFYLDPHLIHPVVNMDEDPFCTDTFHTTIPQSMPILEIDPSLAVGFYCKDRNDFEDLLARLNHLSKHGESVVSVVAETPEYVLKARRKSILAKELMDDDTVFI